MSAKISLIPSFIINPFSTTPLQDISHALDILRHKLNELILALEAVSTSGITPAPPDPEDEL